MAFMLLALAWTPYQISRKYFKINKTFIILPYETKIMKKINVKFENWSVLPSSYGDELTSPGVSSRALFTSVIVPDTGL